MPALQDMTNDILLSAIYAGILCGLGVGLVFKVGASTGGMDIPPLLLNKHFRIPVAVGTFIGTAPPIASGVSRPNRFHQIGQG